MDAWLLKILEQNTEEGKTYTSEELYLIVVKHGYKKNKRSLAHKLDNFTNILFKKIRTDKKNFYIRIHRWTTSNPAPKQISEFKKKNIQKSNQEKVYLPPYLSEHDIGWFYGWLSIILDDYTREIKKLYGWLERKRRRPRRCLKSARHVV